MTKEQQRVCPYCNRTRSINSFIVDYRAKNKYLPYCKSCTDFIVDKVQSEMGTLQALWSASMCNNVPFIKKIWEEISETLEKTPPVSPFALYYKTLKNRHGQYEGVWESDLCPTLYTKDSTDEEKEKIKLVRQNLNELTTNWGRFVNENGEVDCVAYDYLEKRFGEYTENLDNLPMATITQYRNLCKAEWQKIKADESGDINEIDKAQKLLDRLYSILKLDDFATEKSDVDRFIDKIIWRIEETEPAEVEDESKYMDVAGHERNYNSIMRSLRNIVANTRDFPDIPEEEQ